MSADTTIPSPATIYLAEHRGHTEAGTFRSRHTFNFGNYYNENRKPVGDLLAFNEETLAGGGSWTFIAKEETSVMLLPLVGCVGYSAGAFQGSVEACECCIFHVQGNTPYELSNPFPGDTVSYLHIQFSKKHPLENTRTEINFTEYQNRLTPLFSELQFHIGRYDGRQEGTFSCKKPSNKTFIFVIEGAFEVQNRLLESGNGLLLGNTGKIEFEALSNEAIILLIEV
ncbi:MAG TPA: hypothetical protein PLR06_04380 [Cyclobacteriaceae bacterium]|nr:hypothetical protein [Cyclobacteriaceae bacterium]